MVRGSHEFGQLLSAVEALERSPLVRKSHPRFTTLSERIKRQMREQVAYVTPQDEQELLAMKAEFANNRAAQEIIDQIGHGIHEMLLESSHGDTPYPGTATQPRSAPANQETVAGNMNGRQAWAPGAPAKVSQKKEAWMDGLPEESIRSFRNVSDSSPGATIYGKTSGSAPKPGAEKAPLNAPIVYTKLLYMTKDEEKLNAALELLIRNPEALDALFRYVDAKPDYTTTDEGIVEAVLERIPKESLKRYPRLKLKIELGILGWENYGGMKKDGFELKRFIAKGGMGAVFAARQHGVDRDVAAKIITDPDRDPYREARLLGKIQTKVPVVVPIFVGGKIGMYSYLIMPLLKGVSDLSHIGKEKPGEEKIGKEARIVACLKMTESVEAMHAAGIIHRDIKPANFLVKGLRNASVDELLVEMELLGADFGVAREDTDEEKARDRETNEDGSFKIFGTPIYMPQEQASSEELDKSCDVYALAISYYQVLTDSLPYPPARTTSAIGIMSHKMQSTGPDIDENDPKLVAMGLPEELRRKMSRASDQTDRSNRPSATELKMEWEKYVMSFTTQVQEAGKKEVEIIKAKSSMTRRGFLALLAGGAAIIAAGAIPVAISRNKSNNFLEVHRTNLDKITARLNEGKRSEAMQLLNEEISRLESTTDISDEKKSELLTNLRCKKAYMDGVLAYNRGLTADANREFAKVEGFHMAGLTPEEQQGYRERVEMLRTWDADFLSIRNEVGSTYARSTEEFQHIMEGWRDAAMRGDKDAVVKLLQMRFHIDDVPLEPRVQQRVSEFQRRRPALTHVEILRLCNADDVTKDYFCDRMGFTTQCVDAIVGRLTGTIQKPIALGLSQSFEIRRMGAVKTHLQEHIQLEEFDQYAEKLLVFLRRAHILKTSVLADGQVAVDQDGADRITVTNSLVRECCALAIPALPETDRIRLKQAIETEFASDSVIVDTASGYFSMRSQRARK